MAEVTFKPEITEDEWLVSIEELLGGGECGRNVRDQVWAMWRSKPWKPFFTLDRRKMLLMISLFREIEPLIIHPEARELLRVAEQYADDESLKPLMIRADKAVYDLWDGPHEGNRDEQRALEVVSRIWSEPDEAAEAIVPLVGVLHAQRMGNPDSDTLKEEGCEAHELKMIGLLRDIFGNPFRPVMFDPAWRSESAISLARTAYDTRNFSLLPILADALEEAGCDHTDILTHCRQPDAVHVRGCWVVDLVLGKQ